jgi:hypothetical protein
MRRLLPLALLATLGGAGCVTTAPSVHQLNPFRKPATPKKMLVLVTPMSADNGGRMQQGMLCRVYFHETENDRPIPVNGALVVRAHDQSFPLADGKPNGVFHVPADKLTGHLRSDIIGTSYVFWLPYEPQGPTRLMVQAAFEAAGGSVIESNAVALDIAPAGETHPLQEEDFTDLPDAAEAKAKRPARR